MRALFAALFGAGCILLTQRIEGSARALESADIFLRRNLWLLLFGVLHGILIWERVATSESKKALASELGISRQMLYRYAAGAGAEKKPTEG